MSNNIKPNPDDFYQKQCVCLHIMLGDKEMMMINTHYAKFAGAKDFNNMSNQEVFKNLVEDQIIEKEDYEKNKKLWRIVRKQEFVPWPKAYA
jgi:isoaspartyl peptidase/L-asparaginase-like protein (Ntn-hydrolase superfamily)